MPETITEFRGITKPLMYPGPKKHARSVIEDLALYTKFISMENSTEYSFLNLMIGRHTSWDRSYELKPPAYSVSVAANHPLVPPNYTEIKGYAPIISNFVVNASLDGFNRGVSSLGGFTLQSEIDDAGLRLIIYHNPTNGLLLQWAMHNGKVPAITVHVSHRERPENLDDLTEGIVQTAVQAFNRLEPTKAIGAETVRSVIELAYQSNKIKPQCRIRR